MIIETKNLSYSYRNEKVLDNVSITIKKGEFVGIIGPNGSGKTTLLRIIMGFETNYDGEVKIFGQEKFRQWEKIGYLPQKMEFDKLFPATVEEVIGLELQAKKGLFKKLDANDKGKIDNVLDELGIKNLAKKRIGEISGGQLQRVLLAKAMVNNPELIILDEPTIGVDITQQEKFCCLLERINKEKKITILIVSHDMSFISTLVDKIICINKQAHYCGVPKHLDKESITKTFGHAVRIMEHTHRDNDA